jgi:hypothetical protein
MKIPFWLTASVVIAIAIAIAIAAAAPASAGSLNQTSAGYTYFNKPGADPAHYDSDLADCRLFAGTTVQPINHPVVVSGGNVGAGMIAFAIVTGAELEVARQRGIPVNVEDCMVVKGWRVVRVDKAEGDALRSLGAKDRKAKLSAWIGAETPHGDIARVFANEALHADISIFDGAIQAGTPLYADSDGRVHEPDVQLDPDDPNASSTEPYYMEPVRLLKPGGADKPPAGAGLIVVSVAGPGEMGLVLERVGKDGREIIDHDSAKFTIPLKGQTSATANDTTMVFAVAPGRWRLAAVGVLAKPRLSVNFCLGGPSFTLTKGDVVYLGYFNGVSPSLEPDMDLTGAKAVAGAITPVPLHPAEWTNGAVGRCHGEYIYALEFSGRPFTEGYHLGSKALPETPAHP